MGLTLLRLLLLTPMVLAVAFCASVMDNAAQSSPQMAARAMRPPIRFIGSDSLPVQQKTTVHTTVEKPTSHVQEPIPQDRTLDMIRAILAQHDLNAKIKQAEPSNLMGETTATEHDMGSTVLNEPVPPQADSVAFIANHPSDQQFILHSFAENQTVASLVDPAQKPAGVSEVDFPCFGDGYCCCEGCPPGSCPSMFVSVDTGARLPEPLGINTVACPCAVPFEYCCCAGCPRGTCIAGSC
jgi:hypothetical protein